MDCLEPEQTGGRYFRDDRSARTDGGVCQNLDPFLFFNSTTVSSKLT